jgi:EAL domain-containing protein (putative c-di-GMP-specific phosphodiesterase class I)
MPTTQPAPRPSIAAFDAVIAARSIHSVYQPVVSLDTHDVVGYEALARAPVSSGWSSLTALIEYATRIGRLPELDWICRAAAYRGALEAGLPAQMPLFVNTEPASSRTTCPVDLAEIIQQGTDRLQIVAEVTERSVASDPAGLLSAVEQLRSQSHRIALDDVGADADSQAMMSLLRPDVIKLDRTVTHHHTTPQAISVINAARAEAERTGALILAEGIETPQHLASAKSLGATLGQGWLLGSPAALPRHIAATSMPLPRLATPPIDATTPFAVAHVRAPARHATRRELLSFSRALENKGLHATEPTVLLATFQHARYFDKATRRRYSNLAAHGIFTALYAEDLPTEPLPNIRGCPLASNDPLVEQWTVIVIGSHFAGGLFAQQHDMTATHPQRTFDLITSNDRDLILAAARPLLQRLTPIHTTQPGPT